MRVPSRTMSRSNRIVCPACGSGQLQLRGLEPTRCDSCGFSVEDAMFRTIEQIAALPTLWGATPARVATRRCGVFPTECSSALPAARRSSPSKKGDLSNVGTSEGFAEDTHKDERWKGGLIGPEQAKLARS